MARTQNEISQQIKDAILADPILSASLTSLSKTAFYALLADVFGGVAQGLEVDNELFFEEMQAALQDQRVGTPAWYRDETFLFQFGDSLVYLGNGKFGYTEIDEEKQIVKRAAVVVSGSVVLLKVAKIDTGGDVVKLDSTELAALTDYWVTKDFVPSFLQVFSGEGDTIGIGANVEVSPQVFDVTTGKRLTDGVKIVEETIENYISTFTDEDFDGTFFVSSLISEIRKIEGVINVVITSAVGKGFSETSFTNILTEPGEKYNAVAGYFENTVISVNYS